MSELAPIIADLALILILAGAMTILFKKLKQPLVLGYIVAGFLASPHFGLTPSVVDTANIQTWADIGVIFLLFALGLEFSFKKIVKVGGPAIIAALTIIIGMIFLGITVGTAFGWKKMDAIFLGGMIAMSSTTIIYKAFEDLGLSKKGFASLVMSILILEDILAVVLMVMLSTMAVSNSVEGMEMLQSILKLVFFLILWIVVGLYIIPLFLKWARNLMNDETLLVVSLGLCFGMVVIAAKTGFSAAFGAFIMGSILAETLESEKIDKLVKPVKDLFGAIFFVSVGMMVDPSMIVEYALPIIAITLTVLVGQATFATLGVLFSGKSLKTAMQCGFSLTQIGEFAFIIASLGVSLGVTSDFLYPIVVAVSVITIFLTPYMIRLAEPAYALVEKRLPDKWKGFLDRYASGSAPAASKQNYWKTYLVEIVKFTVVYSIICLAIILIGTNFLEPLLKGLLPGIWGDVVAVTVMIVFMSPFLRSIMIKKNRSDEFNALWEESRANRPALLASIIARIVLAMMFVFYVLGRYFHLSVGLVVVLAAGIISVMIMSKKLKKQSITIEKTFMNNLRAKDVRNEYLGQQRPQYAGELLSKDMHLAEFDIPAEAPWVGESLSQLALGKRFGVHVVSILRGTLRLNIPKASDRIFPCDRIQVIGTDQQLEALGEQISSSAVKTDPETMEKSEMVLHQFLIGEGSAFAGKDIRNCGIRDDYHCLVAGVESSDGTLHAPTVGVPFSEGDILWVVGEKDNVAALMRA